MAPVDADAYPDGVRYIVLHMAEAELGGDAKAVYEIEAYGTIQDAYPPSPPPAGPRLDVNMGATRRATSAPSRAPRLATPTPGMAKHGDAVALRPARPGQRGAGGRAARSSAGQTRSTPRTQTATAPSGPVLEFEQAGTAVENGVCSIYLSYDAPFTMVGDEICTAATAGGLLPRRRQRKPPDERLRGLRPVRKHRRTRRKRQREAAPLSRHQRAAADV